MDISDSLVSHSNSPKLIVQYVMSFYNEKQEFTLGITPEGKVELAEGIMLDEASKQFWGWFEDTFKGQSQGYDNKCIFCGARKEKEA